MKNSNRLYVDIHVLQTVPPSCVNRDDTGSPKTAIYGGVRRARVSSQAWKRAVRVAFRDMYAPEDLGIRTKRIVRLVQEEIQKLSPEADAEKLAVQALSAAGLSINQKDLDKGTDALFFMSAAQAKSLAKIAVETPEKMTDKTCCKEALRISPSIDLALFGRMVASDPSLNYDAAAQVAHAISTHSVQNEFDYFTAVDDRAPEDNAGAGHLGTVEFNSSTLYRYATVNVNELSDNLEGATAKAIRDFIEAFACSMPTGKQNTFANRTLPDLVYVTIRKDQPVNLVGAFEQPVMSSEVGGYLEASVNRLSAYAKKLYATFADAPAAAWCACNQEEELAEAVSLNRLLENVQNYLEDTIQKGNA